MEEVDPADGYSIINASETIYLADSGEQSVVTVRFDNAPDGILLIRKVCSVNPSVPLANAEFKITYADGSFVPDANGELSSNGIYYTNKSGEIHISGVVGTVVATETKTIPGFTIDEATRTQTVVVNPNDTQTLTFTNTPIGGGQIIKVDYSTIPGQILMALNSGSWCNPDRPIYSIGLVIYILLLYFFAYFYTSISFNPLEIANNMKKQGGFIPGIRPGKPTSDYLDNILTYIIFIGAT